MRRLLTVYHALVHTLGVEWGIEAGNEMTDFKAQLLDAYMKALDERAQTNTHEKQWNDVERRLRAGGTEGARLFVELARKGYAAKGLEAIMYAVRDLLPLLPLEDQQLVVSVALEGVFKHGIRIEDD